MSRDNFDIPEVFRRAMEDAGWRDEGDDNGGRGRPPFPQNPEQNGRPNRTIIITTVIILLLFLLNWGINTYTEWLWFTELAYQEVWLRQYLYRVISFVIFFILAVVFLGVNMHVARRRALRRATPMGPKLLQARPIAWLINGFALFLGLGFAGSVAANWEQFLLYFYQVPYGQVDPIFNQDISFYLFSLPVWQLLQQWWISLIVLTLIGVVAIYALNDLGQIQRGQWQPQQSPLFRQHIAFLGGLVLLLWASGYIFGIFELLYSPRGVVTGASYTDLNASLYALYAQLFFMFLTALAVLYNMFRFDLRPVGAMAALWLVSTLLVGGIYPGLLQRYSVDPNEIERETPYIEYNIEFTRMAFGLDQVETRTLSDFEDLTQADLAENSAILQNIRLWDYRPLQSTYEQLQALRLYYQFGDIDIDRYMINGQQRQVMLAARELDKGNLPFSSWVNRNLEFTHGYGVVMNPVDQVTPDGLPDFFIKDLPPQSNVDLEITRPEIYYGEMTTDAVFVGSERDEFSYPGDNEPVYSSYEGTGGVPLDSYFKRVAFAIRLGDANLLLSDEINTATRVQFHRQIQERVQRITPFLRLDGDPYIVVLNGRLIWVQDAYTVSDRFPYATPMNGINYIRNSVKVTIDAYNGDVMYYLADPDDPIIQTYSNAFPNLFKPFSDLPEGLENHLRYPEDMFTIQSQQFLRYHMTDVRVFYNQEDLWQIPNEIFENGEQPMEPYYVLLELPGEEMPEYLLIQPMTPSNKDNMVSWLAARNDPPHYGELVVYQLPRQELIIGPSQIEARIDQEPEISEQFSLWNQSGSRVIRGNLLAIPINQGFLYVEPIYLRAETSELPELRRVIVATNSRIAMRPTLDEALTALLGEGSIAAAEVEEPTTPEEPGAVETPESVLADESLRELVNSANAHFEAAQEAQQNGDWATYGAELEALQADLDLLSQYIDANE